MAGSELTKHMKNYGKISPEKKLELLESILTKVSKTPLSSADVDLLNELQIEIKNISSSTSAFSDTKLLYALQEIKNLLRNLRKAHSTSKCNSVYKLSSS